jgi:hypothetical protein
MRPERGHRCDVDKQQRANRAEISEQILECHLFDDILSWTFSMENPDREFLKTDGIGHSLSELFKIQLSVAILICFHDRLINDLLQLLVL